MPSTTQVVQKALENTTTRSAVQVKGSTMEMYIRCRMDPFHSMGSPGIPDSATVRRVVVDHRAYADFTLPTGGSLYLKTLPSTAIPLLSKGTNPYTINGVTYTTTLPTFPQITWLPSISYPEWTTLLNTINPGASPAGSNPPQLFDPYLSARFRIVTQAVRIIYTGQASTCSGIMSMSADTVAISRPPSVNEYPVAVTSYDASGAATTIDWAVDTINTAKLMVNPNFSADTPSTVMSRPETGALILVKHAAPDFDWVAMPNYGIVYEGYNPSSPATATSFIAEVTNISNYGMIGGLDPGWESVNINISGAAAGASFRVECVTCVEYEPTTSSTVSAFAKIPISTNEAAVKAVDAVSKTIPTSLPVGTNLNPWVRMAINAAATAAPIMGSAYGPVGTSVGGLAGTVLSAMTRQYQ